MYIFTYFLPTFYIWVCVTSFYLAAMYSLKVHKAACAISVLKQETKIIDNIQQEK